MGLARYILDLFYKKFNKAITLLGISPTSINVVKASLIAAKIYRSPLMFTASLNQIDIDGGYTGWTPSQFVKIVNDMSKEIGFDGPIIFALDHAGPWLKDEHIYKRFSLDEAMEYVYRSIEAAISAGYEIIHVDTTVDIFSEKSLDVDIVAKRTIDIIEYAESIRISKDILEIEYEIGSDRWGRKDIEAVKELILAIRRGLRDRGIDERRILFVVGDIGTRISMNNRMNIDIARKLVEIAMSFNLYVKGHSTDYVENPEDYRKIGVGGANVGPEFAETEYRAVKKLVEHLERVGGDREILKNILKTINNVVESDGRWRKHVPKNILSLSDLDDHTREWVIGISSRHIWTNNIVRNALDELYRYAKIFDIDAESYIVNRVVESIGRYINAFSLKNCLNEIRYPYQT